MCKKILISIFLPLVLFSIVSAQAVEPVGTVTFTEGICDVARNNQDPVSLKEGQAVYLGDRIRTKSYSKVGLTLADKSMVKLAPSTCVSIEEFRLTDKNQKREFARLKLSRGKVEAVVAKTGKPETFVIDTPNSRGAVKGSDIFVSYLGGKTGVFVQEGALSIFNLAKPEVKTSVDKGNCIIVPFNDVPESARPALDLEMSIHKRDVERVLVKKWIPGKGAAQMNAFIINMSGTVRIYKKGAQDWKEAQANEILDEGDKLQTTEDGKVQLRMSNGNTLLVQPGTELALATMRYDAASGNFENTFEMAKGKVGGVVEKLTKESTFQLKTPTAVCGVRGTVLEVISPAPTLQEPAPLTQVFYEGGNGVVTSLLTGQTQDVAAGQNVSIDPSGNISPPAVTTSDQRADLAVVQEGTQAVTQAAGGVGEGNSDQAATSLVQAQGAAPLAGDGAVLLAGDTQSLALMSTLTFDEVVGTTTATQAAAVSTIYDKILIDTTDTYLNPFNAQLIMKDDNTWKVGITGTMITTPTASWTVHCNNGADLIYISGTTFSGGTWTGTVDSGSVDGKTINSGVISDGQYSGGSFSGTSTGTWH